MPGGSKSSILWNKIDLFWGGTFLSDIVHFRTTYKEDVHEVDLFQTAKFSPDKLLMKSEIYRYDQIRQWKCKVLEQLS